MVSSSGCAAKSTTRRDGSGVAPFAVSTVFRQTSRLACKFMRNCLFGKYTHRFAITVQRAYITVNFSAFAGMHRFSLRNVLIDQCAELLIPAPSLDPPAV